jgi:hypothetical protein
VARLGGIGTALLTFAGLVVIVEITVVVDTIVVVVEAVLSPQS